MNITWIIICTTVAAYISYRIEIHYVLKGAYKGGPKDIISNFKFLVILLLVLISIVSEEIILIYIAVSYYLIYILLRYFLSDYIVKRRITRSILNYRGLRDTVELRKYEDAVERLKELRLLDTPLEPQPINTSEESNICVVCEAKGRYEAFIRQNNSPFLYNFLRTHDMLGHPIKIDEDRFVSDFLLGGTYNRLSFCSETCYSSYILWKYFVPMNKEQEKKLEFAKLKYRAKRYFTLIEKLVFPA